MAFTQAKMTIFFGASGGRGVPPTGWSETWYTRDTSYDATLKSAEKYCKVRKQLLGKSAFLIGARVSDAIVKRDTLITELQGEDQTTSSYFTGDGDIHDPTQVDLLVRVEGGPFYRRSWFVSGLPDSVTDQAKEFGVTNFFTALPLWKQLLKVMTDQRFCIRAKDRDNPNQKILVDITNIIPRMVRNRKRGRPFDLFHGARVI